MALHEPTAYLVWGNEKGLFLTIWRVSDLDMNRPALDQIESAAFHDSISSSFISAFIATLAGALHMYMSALDEDESTPEEKEQFEHLLGDIEVNLGGEDANRKSE